MIRSSQNPTRRELLGTLVMLPAFAAAIATATTAPALAKGSKAAFKYQTSPKNGQKCSGCKYFIAGSSKTANGSCKLVDGSISPKGWCIAYSAKH